MKYVWLALFLLGCTLVPFAAVWANSNLRTAVQAWKQFSLVIGAVLAIAAVVLLGWLVFPPMV